jgi:hypothetical protein
MNGKTVKRLLAAAVLLVASGVVPGAARAGWVVEWTNTAVKRNGERLTSESATMYIDKGRVRLDQPTLTTLIDYNREWFTVLDPKRGVFWGGKVDDYVSAMTKQRAETMRQRSGSDAALSYGMRKVDEKSLPRIEVKKTEQTRMIAEHQTTRYEIYSNGELFEEIWLAEDIDMKGDLDPEKLLAYERKMSAALLGRSAGPFNALHRSKEYADLLQKGFVLESTIHHGAGGFEKKATTIRTVDIGASQFDVPESYRRVQLGEVFPKVEEKQVTPGR